MALFKIHKGRSENLPQTYHEGYAYFTIDDGKFYIDTDDTPEGRIVLNAARADSDRLNNIIDETYITDEELGEIIDGVPASINADTLGGKLASDYVLKTDKVSVNYDQITMPDGSIWDGIAAVTTDIELSEESDNPVANRVITTALDNVDDKISNIKKLTSDSREGETSISAVPIDADKLGGIEASEYALKSEISSTNVADYTALFPTTGWEGDASPFTQTVAVEGILETDNPIVDIDMSNAISDDDSALAIVEWNLIRRIVANNGSITMYCYNELPTKDIKIILKVVR